MTMLDGMRRHKGWLKWSLALVCLAFVFLYVPGLVDQTAIPGTPDEILAQVGEHEITVFEFQQIYRQQLQNYQLQSGGEITEEVLRSLGIDRQILSQMIDEYAELSEATRLGLSVTDAEVRDQIVTLPAFQENGTFIGEARYRQLLTFQNPPITTAQFEKDIRASIMLQRLQSAITDWITVSDEEIAEEHRRRNERVKVDVIAFRSDDYRDEVEVSDEDIELLYSEESASYQVPEKRKLRFLLVDESAIFDSITPTDQEVQEYYDINASQYSTPGQVRARHILLRVEDDGDEAAVETQAAALTEQLRGGADFAALAREQSDDEGTAPQGGDLGLFGRGRMVPEFEAAAFDMAVTEISDPVRSPFGFHVIEVTEKQEEATQPLAEARDGIVNTLKQERASSRAAALATAIAADVTTPADLDRAAAARGFEVQETGFAAQGEPILGLGLASAVTSRAFQLEPGVVDGPIATPAGPAFITVVDRQDPYVPALDEVRDRVRENVIRRKALTLAQEQAAKAAEQLQGAEDFVAAAEEAELAVGSSDLIPRGSALPEVGVNAAAEAIAFALPVGGVSDVIEVGNFAAIMHVAEREEAGDVAAAEETLRSELRATRQNQFFSSYMTKVKEGLAIVINFAALDQLFAT
jgi:peptidyl-prolyl cis-trans isomerase D